MINTSPNLINIVIPMAGMGSRFISAGYTAPKPLIDVFGKPMIEMVIDNLKLDIPYQFIFICQRKHFVEYELDQIFTRTLGDRWQVVLLDAVTEGAACTVLAAEKHLEDCNPVLIANSDQIIDASFNEYVEYAIRENVDGLIMTFPASDPKWSYAKINSDGLVTEVAEKKVISDHATTGIYFFSSGANLKKYAYQMIKKNIRVNNEFYVAPIYNEMIQASLTVKIWSVDSKMMHGIGTPEDLSQYFRLRGGYISRSSPAYV